MFFWAINSTVHNTCSASSSCSPSSILFSWHVTANRNAPVSSHYTSSKTNLRFLPFFFLFFWVIIVSFFCAAVFLSLFFYNFMFKKHIYIIFFFHYQQQHVSETCLVLPSAALFSKILLTQWILSITTFVSCQLITSCSWYCF